MEAYIIQNIGPRLAIGGFFVLFRNFLGMENVIINRYNIYCKEIDKFEGVACMKKWEAILIAL